MRRSILCLLILILSLSLSGCASKPDAEESSYRLSAFAALPDSISNVSRMLVSGDKILLCCREEADETRSTSYAARLNTNGSAFEKLPLKLEEDEKLLDIAQADQGGLWALCEMPQGEEAAEYSLRCFDSANSQTARIPLNEILAREDALHPYSRMSLLADSEGRLCLTVDYGRTYCLFFDPGGNYLFSLRDEGSPLCTIRYWEAQFAVGVRQGMKHFLLPVDIAGQRWGEKLEIEHISKVYSGYDAGGFLLYDSSALYECGDPGDKELLFHWADLGLSSGDPHVCPLGDGRFAVLSSSFSQTGIYSYELCIAEPGKDQRTELEMLSLQPDNSIIDAVAQFNKSSSEYKVVLRSEFSTDENVSDSEWNKAVMKLSTELISGRVPDIIDLKNLPSRAYLKQGILEDLFPRIENDPLIHEDDYFENVFKAMSVDGRLPYVTSNVMVLTMFASPELVGDAEAWTLDEFAALRQSLPNAVESADAAWFLERILRADMRFIDWENGECSFDSKEFISLLQLAKAVSGSPEKLYDEPDSRTKALFVNAASVFDIARCNAQLGGDAVPIGYPGLGEAVHILHPANQIGISATGEHRDGAWEFARSFLEPRQQESGGFFPIRIESFEKIVNAAVKGQSMWAGQFYKGDIRDEDIDLARRVLNSTCCSLDSSDELISIILSGAGTYFEGSRTAVQAAADIQQRAAIYVSEHR